MTIHQEKQGLLSPFLRRRRHAVLAPLVGPGDRVMDLACGSGLLRAALPPGAAYLGVDVLPPPPGAFPDGALFLRQDLLAPDAFDRIRERLPQPPTVIVMAAFLEHVRDPAAILAAAAALLAPGGRIIGTTPAPAGRGLHDTLARLGLCSRDGADQHETFLDRAMLGDAAARAGLRLTRHRGFLLGLNQLFVMEPRS